MVFHIIVMADTMDALPVQDSNVVDEMVKANQGKVTGIIIPPPEIRAIVDKTAIFVAKNGKGLLCRDFLLMQHQFDLEALILHSCVVTNL